MSPSFLATTKDFWNGEEQRHAMHAPSPTHYNPISTAIKPSVGLDSPSASHFKSGVERFDVTDKQNFFFIQP